MASLGYGYGYGVGHDIVFWSFAKCLCRGFIRLTTHLILASDLADFICVVSLAH
jgi:hypothetical protein